MTIEQDAGEDTWEMHSPAPLAKHTISNKQDNVAMQAVMQRAVVSCIV